ncbi:MAG TPA: hypothetical protein VFA72_20385 [Burkholderiales bacterium]|nr:hypothetical protein [Burkholderiales bacterium]
MKALAWLIFFASIGAVGYALLQWRKRWDERQRVADARLAEFIAQTRPAAAAPLAVAPPMMAAVERLLLDAAGKAREAGERGLAIQLYARLIARFPQSALAEEARAAVRELKK